MAECKPVRAGEALSRKAVAALRNVDLWPTLHAGSNGERRYRLLRHERCIEVVMDSIHVARTRGVY
jgi:hypothetical protein